MSARKKSTTSSESSGSSSESSSTSGGSSSGSDSGSSSSDDSDTSSSQRSRASGSGSVSRPDPPKADPKSSQNVKVAPRRRSSEVQKSLQQAKLDEKPPGNKSRDRVVSVSTTKVMQQKVAKNSAYSSDEDIPPPKNAAPVKKAGGQEVGKKRPIVQTNRPKNISNSVPPSTGGKAPPSVLKQHQQSMGALSKVVAGSKAVAAGVKSTTQTTKIASEKHTNQTSKVKKKSIFSPDNSSDTDDATATKNSRQSAKSKPTGKVAPQKTTKATPAPQKTTRKMSSKSSAESSATTTTTTDDSSDSESESASTEDSSPPAKKMAIKKAAPKAANNSVKGPEETVKNHINTDSETEANNKPTIARKLTRSSSTRKSKHLTGKAPSETDSEFDEGKRQSSKSPVKKAPVSSKGKTKNTTKRQDTVKVNNNTTPPAPMERKCPFEGCDSAGHLGGQFDKHFTIEACPLYHNLTVAEAKLAYVERKKRDDERRKAMMAYDSTKKVPTPEQKAYLQRIRESRAKHKGIPSTNSHAPIGDKKKEPKLEGIVSEYDLQLFRDAQALAAENIENELKALPASKGTKYISMGKYKMDVWYQSKYPEDAARLPKLYLCEFCLRYQKSEVGMKRHAAKCVWRHPPGDEIYRKGKLGVWQVDGRKNKIYAQNLCLLAKFFLDYKTLYYDVEPFLFYVMTLADSEGCHTVGYFSKEKNSFLNYNVSCILTLPPYQRKGYGRLLIDFSYLLTRIEGKIGSPEKPLSDLGLISYRSYWKDVLLDYLCSRSGTQLSIKDVSQEMAINSYDIVSTLQALGMMKYWKGKHIILKKQDDFPTNTEEFSCQSDFRRLLPINTARITLYKSSGDWKR
ncbi:histone acetyltransferase KAT7 isoform X2 [Phlebotomus argentipes]|uniref:histone acetyltransferase KAT7 isoform X2 n=1 Tax=Phlebotomus argentipes TaxID=94469 RepID=UPI00289323DC|nr:histone acetyltransferase KAT7 isoform X2 [Phlebotomus argentipes]